MTAFEIIYLVVAILLIIVIILQQRSSGLGEAFGGDSSVFTSRRGAELGLYRFTVILTILFVSLALYSLYSRRATPPPENTEITTEATEENTGEGDQSIPTETEPAETEPASQGDNQ